MKLRIRERARRTIALLPREDRLAIGWALAIKFLLFFFGVKSFQVLQDQYPEEGAHPWLEIWNHWDAIHYQTIAQTGYEASGVSKNFYPFFPWCVRMISQLNKDLRHAISKGF